MSRELFIVAWACLSFSLACRRAEIEFRLLAWSVFCFSPLDSQPVALIASKLSISRLVVWLHLYQTTMSTSLFPDFVSWSYHRSIVLGSWLYVDGGEIQTSQYRGLAMCTTVAINLQENWTNSTVEINLIDKPSTFPVARTPLLWTDNNNTIYTFGGWSYYDPGPDDRYNAISGRFVNSSGVIPPNQGSASAEEHIPNLWSLSLEGAGARQWEAATVDPTQSSILQVTLGSMTASTSTNFYSFAGQMVLDQTGVALPGTVSVPITNPTSWTNSSNAGYTEGTTRGSPYLIWGESVVAPMFGKEGVMIAFGGYSPNGQIAAQLVNSAIGVLQDMSSILVLDIASGQWYAQKARGDQVPSRWGFCSVGVTDQNNSTFDIFIFGGATQFGQEESYNQDLTNVFVLSLPAFTWTRIDGSATNYNRFQQSCNVIGQRQMVVVGGVTTTGNLTTPDPWTNGLAIFDLSAWTWSSSFDADAAPYQRNERLIESTNNSPYPSNWSSSSVQNLFQPNNTSTPSMPPKSHSTDVGAIAGGVVGGIAGLFLLASAVFFLTRHRNRRRQGQVQLESQSSQDAQQAPYEDMQTIPLTELATGEAPHEKDSHTKGHFNGSPTAHELPT